MEEDETFDEFYVKLKDIVNFAFNLGERIAESKIVRKILRSLLERFHAKITAIEEVKDIDQIPLTELVGNLQTYEMRLGLKGKSPRKSKSSKKGKSEKPFIQCHECKDFGHMRIECPNYLMKEKTKVSKDKRVGCYLE